MSKRKLLSVQKDVRYCNLKNINMNELYKEFGSVEEVMKTSDFQSMFCLKMLKLH